MEGEKEYDRIHCILKEVMKSHIWCSVTQAGRSQPQAKHTSLTLGRWDEPVCGREMGGKEKWSRSCTVEKSGTKMQRWWRTGWYGYPVLPPEAMVTSASCYSEDHVWVWGPTSNSSWFDVCVLLPPKALWMPGLRATTWGHVSVQGPCWCCGHTLMDGLYYHIRR